MKVTFVHLGRESLGIEYLSSVLKKAGHETNLALDPGLFSREDNVFYIPFLERKFSRGKQIIKQIQELSPDLVAFSVYTSTYQWACGIAKNIKEIINVPVVFGGIHPTLVPEKVIKNDFVDFVIVGEGEYALLELVEALSSGRLRYEIDNVWFKCNGEVIPNRLRPPINNLDSLPFPDKELFQKDVRYKDDYIISTSRGCLFNCTFCCEGFLNKLHKDRFFRRRSVDSLIEELKFMKEKYNFKEVMFFDAILFTDKEWLKRLMVRFKREIGVPFGCKGHVNLFSWEIGNLLKEGGCYNVDFGIQSMSESTRRKVLNRFESNEQIKRTCDICESLKLRYDVDLIFGLPGEGEREYLLAVEFFKHFKYLNRLKCFNLTYYPGTKIVEIAKEKKMLSEDDIENIKNGKIGDLFHRDSIKDKNLKREKDNFQTFYKLLPLLPSSWAGYILRHRLYRKFYFIPPFLIIFLQVIIAFKHRDYRFIIYFLNYLHHFRKRLIYPIAGAADIVKTIFKITGKKNIF